MHVISRVKCWYDIFYHYAERKDLEVAISQLERDLWSKLLHSGLIAVVSCRKHLLLYKSELKFIFVSCSFIVTDRVRSAREGNVLTRVCPSICLSVPGGSTWARSSWVGGYPCQVQPEWYPTSGTPPPPSDLAGGWGVPHLGSQVEYLIRCGRYASCVHAGGLSCF